MIDEKPKIIHVFPPFVFTLHESVCTSQTTDVGPIGYSELPKQPRWENKRQKTVNQILEKLRTPKRDNLGRKSSGISWDGKPRNGGVIVTSDTLGLWICKQISKTTNCAGVRKGCCFIFRSGVILPGARAYVWLYNQGLCLPVLRGRYMVPRMKSVWLCARQVPLCKPEGCAISPNPHV